MNPKIERALISVSDKTGLVEFCQALVGQGVTLFASGGTRAHLVSAGLNVREIADYTGFPEMMDGRIKTLHPKIHGGILHRHDRADDQKMMRVHGIESFELVVVNLYPFEATVAQPGVELAQAIEKIDVGGPTIVRGAAKNHAFVTICSSPQQYPDVLREILATGSTSLGTRRRLAAQAFELSARYERAISQYLNEQGFLAAETNLANESMQGDSLPDALVLPETLNMHLQKTSPLRYGENPHQAAAVYCPHSPSRETLVGAEQLNGKELSYNNLLDLDAALGIVAALPLPAVSVIKHNNPCGAAVDSSISGACLKALEGDPLSAFGSILAVNREVDEACAMVMTEPDRFIEAVLAPGYSPQALKVLTTRPKWKANVRLLAMDVSAFQRSAQEPRLEWRAISGGFLVQTADDAPSDPSLWECVTQSPVPQALMQDLVLAWQLVRFVKSNAIVVVKDGALAGAGAGQMSRVDSVEIALKKSGPRAQGGVMASDAFFPFPDSVFAAHAAGIAALIQPGGSKKDPEVIAACNELGIPMLFTHKRHFRH